MKKSLFLILLIALLLRLPLLNGSLWLDEAAQAMESSRPLWEQTHIADDYQPPLFHFVIHFFLQVSRDEWWIRSPSLLAGLGTVTVLYLLLEEKYGKKSAVFGALLLATSPFHIFYSQELRPYSLATFFAILSWYILISDRWRTKRWIRYTIVTTLGLYTMYLIPFNILAQLVYVWYEERKNFKPLFSSLCIVALLFLPWLPSFLTQLHVGTQLTTQLPGWADAVATPQLKVLPLTISKFIVGQAPFRGHVLFTLSTAVLLLAVASLLFMERKNTKTRVFFYWFLLPVGFAWLVSFIVPVIQPKRVMFILPAFYALVGISGTTQYKKILIGSLIALQMFCLIWYWSDVRLHREDWKGLVHTIEAQADNTTGALFSFPAPFAPWQWYESGKVRDISTGILKIDDTSQVASVSSQLKTVSRVYMFEYLRDLTDPHNILDTTLSQSGFTQNGKIDGAAIGFVRIFARMR